MNYGPFSSYEEYLKELERFHGKKAPGGVLALHMVNVARELLPEGILMDVICETRKCLADAIQLLTPCTVGNHWLKIVDTGRFAAVFYDKETGEGVRVSLNMERMKLYPAVNEWFLKLIPKKDQDLTAIIDGINIAGSSLFDSCPVAVDPKVLLVRPKVPPVVCPVCGEAYPPSHGPVCRGCQGATEAYFHERSVEAAVKK
ncbi:FmdE family protein [Aminivibrio sp.]|jgi:formylmethanofuran dehydrogenase subunit E|uniref:FmdE family protein n=1 Tax=Aminivibrio sp. TaxID=1872489 RepID=UPI003D96C781|nr:formylmethanofuran dehydrogenase subunit E family protein [Synergistaceae bacterium]MDD4021813.1 formylmethanofuran dehydrogenase subunit E family protein [Synergistaceae bacterium]MDD4612550.1 formylmethanofuran dehydrogenase subunit E family protein [Synergistaceae bacterium]